MEESNDIGETTMVNKNGMKKLYSLKQLEDSNVLLNKKPPVFIKKLLMILVGVLVILVLFITFFKVDISVDVNASVEPSKDIITLKATSKAEIEEIYKKDGDTVEEGEKILKLKNIEKEVPLEVNTIGSLPSGFELISATADVSKVTIRAENATDLAKISEMFVDVDLSDVKEETEERSNLKIYPKENIRIATDTPIVKVTIKIRKK